MNKLLVLSIAGVFVLSGCASTADPNSGLKSGAGIGAVGGAILGSVIGGDRGAILGGAVLGGGVGALIGKDRDAQQRKLEASLAAEQAANQISIQRIDAETIKLNLDSSVTFAIDSAVISGAFQNSLNKIAQSLQEYPNTQVNIIGHTDNTGAMQYNQRLSEQRAESVGYYFSRQGVAFSRLRTQGMGESQPIASNASAYGRSQNRRVEIYLRTAQ